MSYRLPPKRGLFMLGRAIIGEWKIVSVSFLSFTLVLLGGLIFFDPLGSGWARRATKLAPFFIGYGVPMVIVSVAGLGSVADRVRNTVMGIAWSILLVPPILLVFLLFYGDVMASFLGIRALFPLELVLAGDLLASAQFGLTFTVLLGVWWKVWRSEEDKGVYSAEGLAGLCFCAALVAILAALIPGSDFMTWDIFVVPVLFSSVVFAGLAFLVSEQWEGFMSLGRGMVGLVWPVVLGVVCFLGVVGVFMGVSWVGFGRLDEPFVSLGFLGGFGVVAWLGGRLSEVGDGVGVLGVFVVALGSALVAAFGRSVVEVDVLWYGAAFPSANPIFMPLLEVAVYIFFPVGVLFLVVVENMRRTGG